jgi:hypothetical protein
MKRGYTKQLLDAARNWKAGKTAPSGKHHFTLETHRVLLVYRRSQVQGWCPECATAVEMVKPEDAARLLRISLRRVFRKVEAETLHFTETADGLLFICRNSLINLRKSNNFIC